MTVLSVQEVRDGMRILDLSESESAMVAELFGDRLTEDTVRCTNQRENLYIRSIQLEPRTVSAHARMRALARKT